MKNDRFIVMYECVLITNESNRSSVKTINSCTIRALYGGKEKKKEKILDPF